MGKFFSENCTFLAEVGLLSCMGMHGMVNNVYKQNKITQGIWIYLSSDSVNVYFFIPVLFLYKS